MRRLSSVPESFSRDTGGTPADWLRWLPGACRDHALSLPTEHSATVSIGTGHLHLHWDVLPPRALGLARFPHLMVSYRFDGVSEAERQAFMRYFDLYMQRGGG